MDRAPPPKKVVLGTMNYGPLTACSPLKSTRWLDPHLERGETLMSPEEKIKTILVQYVIVSYLKKKQYSYNT